MTHQAPPCRPTAPQIAMPSPARRDRTPTPPRPFVPVPLMPSTTRRKRPHWAVRAVRVVVKALFLCFCVFVGFVTFCVAFHWLTLPG